ncbi:MAG: DNA polymerase III subunit delta [Pseudomonadota bacterium]
MKVAPEKLGLELARRIAPVYVVSGDEPLLVQETCDEIRAGLRKAGYQERELFHADASFDWEQVLFSANSMSLFAEQKLLEVRMPSGKPGAKGAEALKTCVDHLSEGTVLLLVTAKLDGATQKSAWFKALDQAGVFVQVWPVPVAQMHRWIATRATRAGLRLDRDAIDALVDRIEGNLLAAIQEIERLRIISADSHITLEHILEGVADSSRYDVFALIDAALSQDPARTLKIVRGLQAESAEVLYVTIMLGRELRSLAEMAQKIRNGQSPDAAMQAGRVWGNRKAVVSRCLRAHKAATFNHLQQQVAQADQMVKGIGVGDPWALVEDVVLALAGKPVIRRLAS